MEDVTLEEFEDAVLMLTDRPEWHTMMQGLTQEITASQNSVFTRNTWEEVCEEKGFCRGLYYVITLREQVIRLRQEAPDANI